MTKQTVVFDLETMNAITGIERKWQMDILKNLSGGIPAGTMNVFLAGRQTGKSMLMKVLKNRIYDTNLCKEIMLPMHPEPKYKFSRANWHAVQLNGDGIWRLGQEYNEIIAWCNDTFGAHPKRPDAWSRWWVGIGEIYFRDEQDLVMYKLKWTS